MAISESSTAIASQDSLYQDADDKAVSPPACRDMLQFPGSILENLPLDIPTESLEKLENNVRICLVSSSSHLPN